MIDNQNIKYIYFIGIGGIGMSALARYAHFIGKTVIGYDKTETPLTRALIDEGIRVHYEDNVETISSNIHPDNTLVVRTPAVPTSLQELQYFINNNYKILKRSELLGMLTNSERCIAVAGTHGKTSVSTMITHVLQSSDIGTGAFLGGIARNFKSNLVLPSGDHHLVVTEADEYDRSFLQLTPEVAVLTSIDADHLDIYGTEDEIKASFNQFIGQIKPQGTLFVHHKIKSLVTAAVPTISYGVDDPEADYNATNIRNEDGGVVFDLIHQKYSIKNINFTYPGDVNILNMAGAIAVAQYFNASEDGIRKACLSFQGVKRRFDVRYRDDHHLFIDDYAHHPEELNATISSVKRLYPGKKVLGVFQPHLFSRTADFADGFAESLDALDQSVILDIYPAREEPIPGVTSELILQKMKNTNSQLLQKEDVVDYIKTQKFDVLLTLGAGNIDVVADALATVFEQGEL